ncbi:MAG: hypothetical protein KDA84_25925, partial [Planctomycetaceae bacterium]|nr:hypothetical protein [Planctomycetaceae bacterium]
DSQHPVSSVLEFLLSEAEPICQLNNTDAPVGLLAKLIRLDAIQPLDQLWIEHQNQPEPSSSFDLPISLEQDFRLFGLEKQIPFGMGKPLARMAYGFHRMLVPADSGPARVGWTLALLSVGRTQDVNTQLNRLLRSPDLGPLTCWYASRVFGLFKNGMGERFAQAGLEKLSADDFRKEAEQLLPAESLLFELVGSLGNAVRQLDDAEFAQLSLLMGDRAQHPALPNLIKTLRQEQGTPSRTVILESLTTLWTIHCEAVCRKQFEKLVESSTPKFKTEFNKEGFQSLYRDLQRKKAASRKRRTPKL